MQILHKKNRTELLEEALPHFESFMESRERYIQALEQTISVLKTENQQQNKTNLDIRSSIDELVAMQRLSNCISTAVSPESILSTLIELTKQVISVENANIFLLDENLNKLNSLISNNDDVLLCEAQEQLESGIVDWIFSEKKTVIIPDLKSLTGSEAAKNFVIVPLLIRNIGIGVYLIHTSKQQEEFSNQDIQLLSVLANQAAAGVENWRTYEQLKKANLELKASEAQMIHAAKLAAIGELAASIVHEIKNPIQILLLQVEALKINTLTQAARDIMANQIIRLSDISKRLMNFARSASSDFTLDSLSINKPILDVVAMVQPEFKNDNISFNLQLDEQLPHINGNSNYLQQVFLNLVINARDAMPDGGMIAISSSYTSGHVVVRFSDTGNGISKEKFEDIFKPFFTTKAEGKGTGLGLSICKKIIIQHKGKISVESEIGKGTTFVISIPSK